MKRLLILLFILMNLSALGQTYTAERIVATRGFYLKDRWVDSIGVDTTMNGEIRSLPSSDAVHRLVHYRHTALQKALNDSAAALRISLSSVSSLPDQTGNAGKYLTTDGTTASWGTISASYTPTITTSAATTLTLGTSYETYVFTGSSAATWTLPAISGDSGRRYFIKNEGSANLVIQRAGSDQLYTTALVNSITILPGGSFLVQNNGTRWSVID
jgi:hypothetical protein